MKEKVLEVQEISKKFKTDFWKKSNVAVENVSFDVPANSVCGLIGPNGAGKTTMIKIMLGFIRPDKGNILIYGESFKNRAIHVKIGYLPEQAYYYDYLRSWEILDFYGKLFALPKHVREERIESLLKLVGLYEKRDLKLRNFSKGMLQRIGIAQALINDPSLIIFDEPMSGLDPLGRKDVRDIMLRLKEEGKTILFSTHILPDVENLCDHVVMLVKGKVKASGKVSELIQPNVQSFDLVIGSEKIPDPPSSWSSHIQMRKFHEQTLVRLQKTDSINQESILDWVQKNKLSLVSFTPYKENLEDILVKNVTNV